MSTQQREAPADWVMVPREPTAQMCKAAADAWLDCGSRLVLNKAGAAVRAGIAAAPSAPEAQPVTAWMNPDTLDVIHDECKQLWESSAGYRKKAAGYTVPLFASADHSVDKDRS